MNYITCKNGCIDKASVNNAKGYTPQHQPKKNTANWVYCPWCGEKLTIITPSKPIEKDPREMVLAFETRSKTSFDLALQNLVRDGESFEKWVSRTNPTYWNLHKRNYEYSEDKAKASFDIGGVESKVNQWFIYRMLEYNDPRLKGTKIYKLHKNSN